MAFDNLKIAAASSTQPTEPSQISKERLLLITKHARVLFLAYPRSDYDEPDGALASYVEVLSGYSDVIVQHVTSNKTGVQRRSKFPPRVAELVAACDEAAEQLARRKRYENWGCNEPLMIDGPKADKPTLAELKAKYGDNWGIDPTGGEPAVKSGFFDKKTPTWDEIVANYQADPSRLAALLKNDRDIP